MELPIHLLNVELIDAGNMASSITSDSLDVKDAVRLAIQAEWTGSSPVGTLHIKGSNDMVIFTDDPEISAISVSGNSGNALVKIANCSYPYLQLVYISASGTGTLNVLVNGKRA